MQPETTRRSSIVSEMTRSECECVASSTVAAAFCFSRATDASRTCQRNTAQQQIGVCCEQTRSF